MTHIALDARMLGPTLHGLGRYVYSLSDTMAALAPDLGLTLLGASPHARDLAARHPNVRVQPVPARPFSPGEQADIPRTLMSLRPDLYHATSAALPFVRPVPYCVTVPDLIPLLYPGAGGRGHRLYFMHWLPHALARARHVLTFSQATKQDVLTWLHLPAERVTVAPLGVDPMFRPEPLPDEDARRRRLALPEPYLLVAGNPRPHKNLGMGLQVFDAIAERSPDLSLVVLSTSSRALDQAIESARHRGRIARLAGLSDEDLGVVYRAARALFYPSRYEGFGLPVLEAMACGTPVVSSNATSLPEVVGDAGILVDASRPEEAAAAVLRLCADADLRGKFRDAGLKQAAEFTWERCARITLEVYSNTGGFPKNADTSK
ncbi:MAG: glycosyltransferase family 4 protein [Armatimonadetes bacterium]|nr:glycosyltransferase family 4 protein [Armatimonadota bacterium]